VKGFKPGKCVKRLIKIKSSDRAISDADWVLTISGSGVTMKRFGDHAEGTMSLSWRSIISHALIHRAGWRPAIVEKGTK
jgi:hypothetical protein